MSAALLADAEGRHREVGETECLVPVGPSRCGKRAELERDPWSGHMAFPGGRLEPGETPLACAIREVEEELCVTPTGVAPAGTQGETTGHHHLLVDDPQVDLTVALPMTDNIKHFGGGQTETTLTLKPGKHTLQLLFADWKHQSFNPAVMSPKITITVK